MKILIFVLGCIVFILLMLIISTISVRIEKFNISNMNIENKLKLDYKIYFEIFIIDKIKILSIKLNEEKIRKTKVKEKMEKIGINKVKHEIPSIKEGKDIIKKLKIKFEKLKFNLEIGTEDVIITSSIVTIIASALGIVLAIFIKDYKKDKYEYKILPIYQNKNIINLNLNCIIKVKIVHIIFIIYILLKKGRVNKNERTSNRRTYDYSYE